MNYFTLKEMKCHCGCDTIMVDPAFLAKMNDIREEFGKPIMVNSWFRCKEYDKIIGGKGNHPTGAAGDFRCYAASTRFTLIRLALKHGIRRIGVGRGFLHFDICDQVGKITVPSNVMWVYG